MQRYLLRILARKISGFIFSKYSYRKTILLNNFEKDILHCKNEKQDSSLLDIKKDSRHYKFDKDSWLIHTVKCIIL